MMYLSRLQFFILVKLHGLLCFLHFKEMAFLKLSDCAGKGISSDIVRLEHTHPLSTKFGRMMVSILFYRCRQAHFEVLEISYLKMILFILI